MDDPKIIPTVSGPGRTPHTHAQPTPRNRGHRRTIIIAALSLVVGVLAVGIPALMMSADHADEIAAAKDSADSLRGDIANLEGENEELQGLVDELDDGWAEHEDAMKDLDDREAEIDEREEDVTAREDAVAKTEEEAEANSFSGGTHRVGTDIKAGTYRNSGGDTCYWARLSGGGGELGDIIANDNPGGPATVTISASDWGFESTRCGEWSLVD